MQGLIAFSKYKLMDILVALLRSNFQAIQFTQKKAIWT